MAFKVGDIVTFSDFFYKQWSCDKKFSGEIVSIKIVGYGLIFNEHYLITNIDNGRQLLIREIETIREDYLKLDIQKIRKNKLEKIYENR